MNEEIDTAILEENEVKQKMMETIYRNGGEVSRDQITEELRNEDFYEGRADLSEAEVELNGKELDKKGYLDTTGQSITGSTFTLTDEGRKAFEMWSGLTPSVETGYQEIGRMLETDDREGAEEFITENYDLASTEFEILSEVYENRTGDELNK